MLSEAFENIVKTFVSSRNVTDRSRRLGRPPEGSELMVRLE